MVTVSHARALALALLLVTMLVPAPAMAEEESITFDGGGWGHGVGFSQWGAQNMALDDPALTGQEIATHYYLGTSIATAASVLPETSFLVAEPQPLWIGILQTQTSFAFRIEAGSVEICQNGDGYTGCERPQPQEGETWTFSSDPAGRCVFANGGVPDANDGNCLASIALDPGAVVRIVDGGGTIFGPDLLLTSGTIKMRPPGVAPSSPDGLAEWIDGPTFHVSATMDVEPYLNGIAEVIEGWEPAALEAQAIAARSYAMNRAEARESGDRAGNYLGDPGLGARASSCWCHLYRDERDMNYEGQPAENAGWVAAVADTLDEVLTHPTGITQFGIIEAYFSSSTFGMTESNVTGFGSTVQYPYLVSVDDHWAADANLWAWPKTVPEATVIDALASTFRPWKQAFDDITSVSVQPAPGAIVTFEGVLGGATVSTDVPGWWLRSGIGLNSPGITSAEMTGDQGPPPGSVARLAGEDRYRTAVAVSQSAFPAGADTVLIATGENFPDSLAGTAAGFRLDAPILLTNTSILNTYTKQELTRLAPSEIFILGGPAAVSEGVEQQLAAFAPTVSRLAGLTRYETATAISQHAFAGDVSTIFVVTGADFPEAVVAGPAAAQFDGPVLLTRSTSLPTAVRAEIQRLTPDVIVLVASDQAVNGSVEAELAKYAPVTRITGADRYVTSALVSAYAFGSDLDAAFVATGSDYPDALTGGLAAALAGGPVLLVTADSIPTAVGTELDRLDPFDIVILGGTGVVSEAVEEALTGYLVP